MRTRVGRASVWIGFWLFVGLTVFPLSPAWAVRNLRVALVDIGAGLDSAFDLEGAIQAKLELSGVTGIALPSSVLGNLELPLSPREVRRLAFNQEVDRVVVGEYKKSVNGFAAEYTLEVMSGQSGVLLGRRTEEAALMGKDSRMTWADWVVVTLDLPARVRSQNASSTQSSVSSVAEKDKTGLGGILEFDQPGDQLPLRIDADSLEVFGLEDSSRRIIFRKNVRVKLGEMIVLANQLEAFYEAGQAEPERLVAKGQVRINQGARNARCEVAEYSRSQDLIVCSGKALLIQGCDTVRGQRIELDLSQDRARVEGTASVVIQPVDPDFEQPCLKGNK
ncbi:MAG: hypothetical protein CL917_07040 [Deltaproteobacteria bacterium]|nr:hypothetical protein [Deltaproteobacteria bacterium]